MRRKSHRSLLKAVAPLIVAGTLTLAATAAAAGIEPASPTPLTDSAFAPVTAPSPSSGGFAAPAAQSSDLLSNIRQPERAQPSVRPAKPIVVSLKPVTTHMLSGPASWYCRAGVSPCTNTQPDNGGFDAYAAAGPKLRAAIGPGWRGMIVYVDGIRVKLIDWCQCYNGEPQEKLLDLYYDVYARTGTAVIIRW